MGGFWEQASKKVFDRTVSRHKAVCQGGIGSSRYDIYTSESGVRVARKDNDTGVFEIHLRECKAKGGK